MGHLWDIYGTFMGRADQSGKIANREYREINSISSKRLAAEKLGYLVDNNIMIKHGKGRSMY